jgi:hypothetical protein
VCYESVGGGLGWWIVLVPLAEVKNAFKPWSVEPARKPIRSKCPIARTIRRLLEKTSAKKRIQGGPMISKKQP